MLLHSFTNMPRLKKKLSQKCFDLFLYSSLCSCSRSVTYWRMLLHSFTNMPRLKKNSRKNASIRLGFGSCLRSCLYLTHLSLLTFAAFLKPPLKALLFIWKQTVWALWFAWCLLF